MSTASERFDTVERRSGSYSSGHRTALVFCGTGAHGAYHAGVLRAIHEAGVRVDVVAGHGIGAGVAALAAIDGGARLWEPDGVWRSPAAEHLYSWNAFLRAAGWIGVLLALVFLLPILVLAGGLLVYAAGFLLTLVGLGWGDTLIALYSRWMQSAFAADQLPTIVPRLVMLVLLTLLLLGAVAAGTARWRSRRGRRWDGAWWWQLMGAPLDASGAHATFIGAIWGLIGGAGASDPPARSTVSRRYAEVLAENVGQPGFRELVLIATDLDARRDVVAALLREPYSQNFLTWRDERERHAEVFDLAGSGRDRVLDLLAGALTPPVLCSPALVTFAVDSHWRGETHRFCDRPASTIRLLEEVAAAGVTQVIVVSGVEQPGGPHRLGAPRLDPRHRLGEFVSTAECVSLRDALHGGRLPFDALYLVSPAHNAIGPFDFRGAYDEASDRHQSLAELMDRGYDDAYRQFISPVVGASGEQIGARVGLGS